MHIGTNEPIHIKPCMYIYFQNNFLDEEYPWTGIPAATSFAV